MDDQTTQALTKPAVEDNSPTPAPSVEPTTSDQTNQAPVADTPVATPVQAEVVEAERQPRAERRIQQLSAKLKEAAAQPSYVPQYQQSPQAPNLSELIGNQESIDPEALNKLGQQLYQQGAQTSQGLSSLEVQALRNEIQQKEAISNYSRDEETLPMKYDELNPDSPKYNSVLDEKISKAYADRAVKQTQQGLWVDPSVKLADVAADWIELARSSADSGRAQSAQNLATLADNSAITPNSDTVAPTKDFNDMSLKEMEAHLRTQGRDV